MKLIIVLCLGTLALSAPAPRGKRQIDFLWQSTTGADEETPASVRPVEQSTVEPKVTATKITDPRTSVPVFEEEEEEAVVQEEPRVPTASPLNLEQSEQSDDESVNGDNSELSNDTNGEQNQEKEEETETNEEGTTERAVVDTTIRVYDEEEVNGKEEEKVENEQEQDHQQKEEEHEQQQEDKEQELQVQQQEEKEQEHQEQQQQDEKEQEQHQSSNPENEKLEHVQQTDLNDSYQYDDESQEHALRAQGQPTTTGTPESYPGTTEADVGFDIEVTGGTLVVDKDTIENLKLGKPGLQNWPQGPPSFEGPHDHPRPYYHHGHHDDDHRGPPHGFHGFHGHPGFHGDSPFGTKFHQGPPPHGHPFDGPPPQGHPFDGPPPSWLKQGHGFPHEHTHDHHSHDHNHDHKYHFKGHDGSKGYPFHDNAFHRGGGGGAPWSSWKTTLPAGEGTSTEVTNLLN